MDLSKTSDLITSYIALYGGKVLLAVITLIVGLWVIGQLTRLLARILTDRHVDRDVQPFLLSLASGLLRVLLLLSVAGMLGIETTSFVAIVGAAGLAVGLALQGSLANFAGGVLILVFKPFRVGDLINAQGFTGNVEAIQIFNTILNTLDNKTIILPNGPLSTSPVTNISGKGKIRVDMTFAAGNQNKLDDTLSSLRRVVSACPTALTEQAHDVLVNHASADAIIFDVRVWTHPDHYWDTYYFVQENVIRQFGTDGIKGAEKVQLMVNS